ncbi:MAG TPA: aminopeptidase [Gemmatimonadales bacterium]|nr:aminopeptidase [Gemmatimonadales bacterium]
MIFAAVVALVIGGYSVAFVSSADVRYIHRSAVEEGRILAARKPIAKLLQDPALPAERRHELTLVLQARDFASTLGLQARKTYTTYADVGRDTLLLVLSAAPHDRIAPYTWHYPIVGRIPYKGFFDFGLARRTAADLDRRGYDVYLRPAAAFSTLGWFNDPLLSTAITPDSMELVALVLHEIAHNTLWVKSNAPFNESYAQLVGYRGAEAFFRVRGDSVDADRAAARWNDEILLSGFYHALIDRLDSAYATAQDSSAVTAARAAVAAWATADLRDSLGPRFKSYRVAPEFMYEVNNARLVGATIYRTHLDWLDRWYQACGGDVARAVAGLDSLVQGVPPDSAFVRLGDAVHATIDTTAPPAGVTGVR